MVQDFSWKSLFGFFKGDSTFYWVVKNQMIISIVASFSLSYFVLLYRKIVKYRQKHTWCIWKANSRVGAKTSTWIWQISGRTFCKVPMLNVAVFPVPLWALKFKSNFCSMYCKCAELTVQSNLSLKLFVW